MQGGFKHGSPVCDPVVATPFLRFDSESITAILLPVQDEASNQLWGYQEFQLDWKNGLSINLFVTEPPNHTNSNALMNVLELSAWFVRIYSSSPI